MNGVKRNTEHRTNDNKHAYRQQVCNQHADGLLYCFVALHHGQLFHPSHYLIIPSCLDISSMRTIGRLAASIMSELIKISG